MSGLLLDAAIDLWADGGLLGVPDAHRQQPGHQDIQAFREQRAIRLRAGLCP